MTNRFFLLLFTVLILAACSGQSGREAGEFRVGLESQPANLDPRYAADAHSVRIVPLVFNGLLAKADDGSVEPDLAEAWERPEPTLHVFRLKQGVRFHDGRVLTSADVAATFDYVRDPKNGSPHSGTLEALESVSTPDERTVAFRLKRPYVSFPFSLTLGILPRDLAGQKDLGDRLIGTGPFRLAGMKPGEEVVLSAFDECFKGAPRLRKVRFRILPNATTRMLEVRTGGVDLLQNAVPPYSVKFLEREPGLKVIRAPGGSFQYLGFNFDDPVLKNPKVRKAIAHGVDRDSLIRFVMQGQARPASGVFPPEHRAYADAKAPGYDPAEGKKLLDEAGYPDPDGDGPLPRLTLSYKTSTDKTALEMAALVADQLSKVGLNVEVRGFEWGTFFGDVKKGDFQLMSLRWVGLTDPDAFHYLFHTSSIPPAGANRGRYRNTEVDALIDRSRGEYDDATRMELYREIQRRVSADDVYVSLYWLDNVIVMREGWVGFRPLAGGEYTSLAQVGF